MPWSTADTRNYLAIGQQTARGTEATTFTFAKYNAESGFEVEQEFETEAESGDGQNEGLAYKTFIKADPQLSGNLRPDIFTRLSAYICGSQVAPPSVGAAAVATHVFTPNATIPYLTIEQAYLGGNTIDRVVDCIAKSVTISGEAGKPWKYAAEFVGGGTVYGRNGAASALTATYEANGPYMYAGGAYVLDGATSLDVEKFEFKFERVLDEDLFTVSPFRRAVVALKQKVSLDSTYIVEDDDLYQKVKFGAAGGTVIPVNLSTGAFAAQSIGQSSQMARIDIPLLYHVDAKLNRLDPDAKTVKIDLVSMGVKGGTGILQLRSNVIGIPSAIIT